MADDELRTAYRKHRVLAALPIKIWLSNGLDDPLSLREEAMAQPELYEILILGSGTGGKLVAWHMAKGERRTAVVERMDRGLLSQWR